MTTFPDPQTGKGRMLLAMLRSFPAPAFGLNDSLKLMANNRARDLRDDHGWPIGDAVPRTIIVDGVKRVQYGYRLSAMPLIADANVPGAYRRSYNAALRRLERQERAA